MKTTKQKIAFGIFATGLLAALIYYFTKKKNSISMKENNTNSNSLNQVKKFDAIDLELSTNGLDFIKRHEGLASISPASVKIAPHFFTGNIYAYLDAVNVPTIGYGHTKNVSIGDVITTQQAETFLREDVASAESAVKNYVKVPVTQNMYDALVSFVFNLGSGSLQKSTLLKKLNKNDYNEAANQFLRWTYAGGVSLAGLEKRRTEESNLFLA